MYQWETGVEEEEELGGAGGEGYEAEGWEFARSGEKKGTAYYDTVGY